MSDGLQGVPFLRILLLYRSVEVVELRALFWSVNLLFPYLCSADQATFYAGVLATTAIVSDSQHTRGYGLPSLVLALEAVHASAPNLVTTNHQAGFYAPNNLDSMLEVQL